MNPASFIVLKKDFGVIRKNGRCLQIILQGVKSPKYNTSNKRIKGIVSEK